MQATQERTTDQNLRGWIYAMSIANNHPIEASALNTILDQVITGPEKEDLWGMIRYLRFLGWSHLQIFAQVVHDLSGFYSKHRGDPGADFFCPRSSGYSAKFND